MSDCWVCKQKAEWRQEKLRAAREAAQLKANQDEKTMAIWKEGCEYKYGDPANAGAIIEYISVNKQTAAK